MRDAFRVDFGLLLRHVGRYRGEADYEQAEHDPH
jgi:hypothetical protein